MAANLKPGQRDEIRPFIYQLSLQGSTERNMVKAIASKFGVTVTGRTVRRLLKQERDLMAERRIEEREHDLTIFLDALDLAIHTDYAYLKSNRTSPTAAAAHLANIARAVELQGKAKGLFVERHQVSATVRVRRFANTTIDDIVAAD